MVTYVELIGDVISFYQMAQDGIWLFDLIELDIYQSVKKHTKSWGGPNRGKDKRPKR